MDIDRDQATPTTNFREQNDGIFQYQSDNGDFDVDRFNLFFEQYRERRKKEQRKKMRDKLDDLNAPPVIKPIYKYSIGQIAIDTKDALFQILDDVLQGRWSVNTFTRDNRMFYIGIVFILLASFAYLYTMITNDALETTEQSGRFEIQHVHKIMNLNGKELVIGYK